MPTPHRANLAVRRALRKLGADLKDARRRRRLPARVVAERAFTTRPTLQRVEAGDTGVSIGIYAAVMNALGLLRGLESLADIASDPVGLDLERQALPQRTRARTPRGDDA